jgi:dTDP-4-dehydrorhamnose reductase
MAYKIYDNVNGFRDATAEETTQIDADRAANPTSAEKKLAKIKQIRQWELEKTDYLANSDVTMPDYIKTWRQTLRDLPQNNTTESQYNTLLERNADGSLKNSVWTQPTE